MAGCQQVLHVVPGCRVRPRRPLRPADRLGQHAYHEPHDPGDGRPRRVVLVRLGQRPADRLLNDLFRLVSTSDGRQPSPPAQPPGGGGPQVGIPVGDRGPEECPPVDGGHVCRYAHRRTCRHRRSGHPISSLWPSNHPDGRDAVPYSLCAGGGPLRAFFWRRVRTNSSTGVPKDDRPPAMATEHRGDRGTTDVNRTADSRPSGQPRDHTALAASSHPEHIHVEPGRAPATFKLSVVADRRTAADRCRRLRHLSTSGVIECNFK